MNSGKSARAKSRKWRGLKNLILDLFRTPDQFSRRTSVRRTGGFRAACAQVALRMLRDSGPYRGAVSKRDQGRPVQIGGLQGKIPSRNG